MAASATRTVTSRVLASYCLQAVTEERGTCWAQPEAWKLPLQKLLQLCPNAAWALCSSGGAAPEQQSRGSQEPSSPQPKCGFYPAATAARA